MNKKTETLIFEQGAPGRTGVDLPDLHSEWVNPLPSELLRNEIEGFPEVTEGEIVRHFTRLSRLDVGVDDRMYPLGSCTMKHNPRIGEEIAKLRGFAFLHPETAGRYSLGALRVLFELQEMLKEICGMAAFTLCPVAGAHGELTGLKIIRAAIEARGEKRKKILVPASAHGTNPASAVLAGFEPVAIEPGQNGVIEIENIQKHLGPDVAALMMTNPNTLGLFETNIVRIAELLHENGSFLYCDGANLNAFVGIIRPGDLGVDVIQTNMHKTFSTPHGGGGPGAGPVGVSAELVPFLPYPHVRSLGYFSEDGASVCIAYRPEKSIGRVHSYMGNFLVLLRAYAYILSMGAEGLRNVAETAVLNANYLRVKLEKAGYHVPFNKPCLHECLVNDENLKPFVYKDGKGRNHSVDTMDVAKALLDKGYHPMTVFFPLIVHDAMLIEPTETETKETLDQFVSAMKEIAEQAAKDPDSLRDGPRLTPIRRVKETEANLPDNLNLRWKP